MHSSFQNGVEQGRAATGHIGMLEVEVSARRVSRQHQQRDSATESVDRGVGCHPASQNMEAVQSLQNC